MFTRSALRSGSRFLGGGAVLTLAGRTALHHLQEPEPSHHSTTTTLVDGSNDWTLLPVLKTRTAQCDNGSMAAAASSSPSSSLPSLVLPTLQATARAARLFQTFAAIAVDYYYPSSWPLATATAPPDGSSGSDEPSEQKVEHWEAQVERLEKALYDAQVHYTDSTNKDPTNLDYDPNREQAAAFYKLKQEQRRLVTTTAQELAAAQQQLQIAAGAGSSRKSVIHRQAANRLLQLCRDNGGVYVKIGQHLAQLDYLIPEEYIETLATLFDDTPQTAFSDMVQVIREDLGCQDLAQLFDGFEIEPIASASLAQVHVAYEKGTGRKLAVKVQHRGLRETAAGDIFALETVVHLAERLFTDFSYGWIADEIAPHLPKELDFLNEGRNAERAAADLQKTGLACVVPKVLWKYSSPRVMTMEFEEGFRATDLQAIEAAGLKKKDVARLISSVFSSQVFLSGFVHCDPHPANVLLRAKNGKPEVVLVDHGLYRELDKDFQLRYSRLWKSLMLADLQGIKKACRSLGVDEAYTLFAAMLTARPFDEIIERSKKGSLGQKVDVDSNADKAVIRGYVQQFIHSIFDLIDTIPRQMLLLLKMNDCLRHIDYSLGSPTNTIVVCGDYAARAIYNDDLRQAGSFFGRWRVWLDYLRVVVRIQVHDLGVWWYEQRVTRVLS